MPRNYDSSLPGDPYWRVTDISIQYDQAQTALIGYTEQLAVVTRDGKIEHLSGVGTTRRGTLTLSPAQYNTAIPMVVNPTTGATQGNTTLGVAMLHVLSTLRWDQRAFDAAQDAPPAPAPEPEQP